MIVFITLGQRLHEYHSHIPVSISLKSRTHLLDQYSKGTQHQF